MSDYPTEEELEKIKNWPWNEGLHSMMEYVRDIWWMPDWGYAREGNIYYISTGGWSGNESIIDAMQSNVMWWAMYWCQSRRGGHYAFASTMDWIDR